MLSAQILSAKFGVKYAAIKLLRINKNMFEKQ